jgi:hypothetical protein
MNRFCLRLKPPVLLTAVLLLGAGPSVAVPVPWDPLRSEPLSTWAWALPQVVDLPGARLQIWTFQAPLPPVDAARWLRQAGASRFDRLQLSGHVLSLAGLHEGRHWLAHLRPSEDGKGGTAGLLSSLGPQQARPAGFDPAALLPPGARPVLNASSRLGSGASRIASYLCPGSYLRVAAAVRQALWARHWRPWSEPLAHDADVRAVPMVAGEWVRADGARLTVHLQTRADAVAVTLWHRSKESP